MSEPFIGQIRIAGFTFAPRGYTDCDGQLLAINSNQALFSLFGTIYGGDGRTTFALPDLRGRAALHQGTGAGLSPRPLGQRSGQEDSQLAVANVPAHHHTTQVGGEANQTSPAGHRPADAAAYTDRAGTGASAQTNNTGGGQSFTNMQPFLVVRYFVALVGVFPSRN